jgi:hypothetical protein
MNAVSRKAIKEERKGGFIRVEVNATGKQSQSIPLQFKLPNGLVIEGSFSLSEVRHFIKELSHGLPPLC